mmetsp:Transcript_18975/g.55049  ORF Transcript_18975/g.55049 Transcript_18975/m.55049 type:complete len:207 (+) Transcript_18975:112-732(+)
MAGKAADGAVVGQPVAVVVDDELPVLQCGATGAAANVEAGAEKPCTPLCSWGTAALTIGAIAVVASSADMLMELVVIESSMLSVNRLIRLTPIAGLLCTLVAALFLFRERPVPRGCSCQESCRLARTGCCSCPITPWGLLSVGLWSLGRAARAAVDVAANEEEEKEFAWAIVAVLFVFSLLTVGVGSGWLLRFRRERGHVCCAPGA